MKIKWDEFESKLWACRTYQDYYNLYDTNCRPPYDSLRASAKAIQGIEQIIQHVVLDRLKTMPEVEPRFYEDGISVDLDEADAIGVYSDYLRVGGKKGNTMYIPLGDGAGLEMKWVWGLIVELYEGGDIYGG